MLNKQEQKVKLPTMTKPMSDEVLADYERGFAAEGELRGTHACEEIRRLQRGGAAIRTVDIVFDGPPSHVAPGFVEVEVGGKSTTLGEWVEIRDGYWALRFLARLEKKA